MSTAGRLLRRLVREVWSRPPRASRAGTHAYIFRPRRIDGPQFIEMGERSTVDSHSWLSALKSYAGVKYQPSIVLGDDVHIGRYACLTSVSSIVIEDGCLI